MRYIFKFPDIGEGITEGRIIEWHFEKGSPIKSGEALVKMETDKVVADIPSPKDGIIVKKFGKEGDIVNVDDALVELEIDGTETENSVIPETSKVKEEGFGVVGELEIAGDNAFLPSSNEGSTQTTEKRHRKILATPVARAMAKEYRIDIQSVIGTGPAGRVTKDDIKKFHLNSIPVSVEPRTPIQHDENQFEELTQLRKTIARRMTESKQTIPELALFEEVNINRLVEIRNRLKPGLAEEGVKLTFLPFIVKAVTESLKKHRVLNARADLENNRIIHPAGINIGIAVDTIDGLMVPVIKNADQLSIRELAVKIQNYSAKAHNKELKIDELRGGTFSITNFGSFAGIWGVPIINYPESAILGIGRLRKIPIVENDEIVVGNMLPLSLAADHRIIDGGEASRFISSVLSFLNDPISLIL